MTTNVTEAPKTTYYQCTDPAGHMNLRAITRDPEVLGGKPVIAGTRISVELITRLHEGGVWSESDILESYPSLTAGDIEAALAYKATGAPLSNVTWEELEAELGV